MKEFHFIYKTTNLANGKYYIGAHSTSNLDDGYLGSEVAFCNALKKYGERNFKREILEFVSTREDKWNAERKRVTPEVVKDQMSYNQF